MLALPHFQWNRLPVGDWNDLVAVWARSTSVVPYTEEVCQSVVDMLLQFGSEETSNPSGVWSWLKERPSLPPTCLGRRVGTRGHVVETVQALNNLEVLKSYFLLVWSEWGDFRDDSGFREMCATLWENFCGTGTSYHRTELLQRLDHILGQLDLGLEHLK